MTQLPSRLIIPRKEIITLIIVFLFFHLPRERRPYFTDLHNNREFIYRQPSSSAVELVKILSARRMTSPLCTTENWHTHHFFSRLIRIPMAHLPF
jgi:hypothetical protein